MASRRKNEFSRISQLALLVMPLVALLALGVYFIVRDKRWVEQEARERASEIVRATLEQLRHSTTNVDVSPFLEVTNRWPQGTAFFQVGSNFELIYPPPVRETELFDAVALLHGVQTVLWREAEAAEFESNDFALANQVLASLIESKLPEAVAPVAKFRRAVVLEKMGRTNDAYPILAELQSVSARLESGLPVNHLAAIKLLAMASNGPGSEADRVLLSFALRLIAAQMQHPSEITPLFFREGSNSGLKAEFERALEIWNDHQRARRLHAKLRDSPTTNALLSTMELERQQWWSFRAGTNFLLRSTANLKSLLDKIARELGAPPYLKVGFASEESDPDSKLLAEAAEGTLRIEARLADPAALYALHRQRAWLFGGVLASSLLVAGAGLIQIHRNYRRQERLNELKSNFVSSVSHELRAPLASMRLMSEGLQRGRVQHPEKQREYFEFLVQECRRLSVLVENVLDFSRIEQDRKSYTFAEANLRDICEAALKTISPVAHEHGMKLELKPGTADPVHAEVDALALQQAIVNLLDNAVKHSPQSGIVTLRLESSTGHIEISVEDHGCGIPPSEHERIFEQFYRLGSELRRETQGVGIGLSIVKHIVEAHGGRVLIRSAPGEGATFTIRIPLRRSPL